MNCTQWAIQNKTTVLIFSVLTILAGLFAYTQIGKLSNPSFTIQTALVITEYPGASVEEVELQVTEAIEKAAQKMGSLEHVRSVSQPSLSIVYVDIKESYTTDEMPDVWMDLRERVHNAQADLPPDAMTSVVVDHFGDTYGIFLALTGDGYSYHDLREFALYMQKRLKGCQDAAQVELFGVQQEQITVTLSRERMANLAVNPQLVAQTLASRNKMVPFGSMEQTENSIRIAAGGDLATLEDLEKLVVADAASGGLIRLCDVADITRGYQDPAQVLFRFNGKPAIGIGISTADHGNTITLGDAVEAKVDEMIAHMPAGLELHTVNFQSNDVKRSINSFILALIEAIVIVLFVLFCTLGVRSAVVITNGLLVNITGTFLLMWMFGIDLQIVSIASLIIALGMLVDDSVVVTDNVLVRMNDPDLSTDDACVQAAQATGWPQLVATIIAIASFLPIEMARSETGEYCKTLFEVVAIALAISWVQAMTVVPVMSGWLLKRTKTAVKDPYQNLFYRSYKKTLLWTLKHRLPTLLLVVVLFGGSAWAFGWIPQVFIPADDRPQFAIKYWLPEGTRIEKTAADAARIEKELLSWPEVKGVATTVGSGPLRFVLTLTPEQWHSCYAMINVNTKEISQVKPAMEKIRTFMESNFPEAQPLVVEYQLSGAPDFSIEVRLSGEDRATLRKLARQVEDIYRAHPAAWHIQTDWRNQVPVWAPDYYPAAGSRAGVSREQLAESLLWRTQGARIGIFREQDLLIPIVMRAPEAERLRNLDAANLPVWGSGEDSVPLAAVTVDQPLRMEDNVMHRRDRIRTITVQCCERPGTTAAALRNELLGPIQALELPPGYTMEWGGLYEYQNKSNKSVYTNLPLALAIMFLSVVLLFNGVRQPLIVVLTLPLSLVGITCGLLLFDKGFGFMAMLGMLSLVGMMIRNAVILIGETDMLISEGMKKEQAVIHAAMTRVRPVMITACTTTFGMIPLINDTLFGAMAVTIMGGLMFATLLTLLIIPVLYALFFRVPVR